MRFVSRAEVARVVLRAVVPLGLLVGAAPADHLGPAIASDGAEGANVARLSPSPEPSLLPAQPNPARGSMTLRYVLPRGAGVRLAIFDVTGLRIRTLVSELQPAGEHVLDWDLRDDQGRAVNAGVCFARLDVEHRTLARILAMGR